MKTDVIIIGGGVAGLSLARNLEKKSIDYLLLENNREIGKYGNRIINKEVFKLLGLRTADAIRPIKTIKFFSPSEIKIEIHDDEPRGFVVNMINIEKRLYSQIRNQEKILLGEHVYEINLERPSITSIKRVIEGKCIIFASGAKESKFREILGLDPLRNVLCFSKEIVAEDEIVTVLDNEIAHGFYGWIIPLQDDIIEIGFGTDNINIAKKSNPYNLMFSFPYLKKYKSSKEIPDKNIGGLIPISLSKIKNGTNWIAIGDAAGGEPLMGASIHKCVDEAMIACASIEKFLENGETLEGYSMQWDHKLAEELKVQTEMRELIDKANNRQLDSIFLSIKDKRIWGHGLINELFKKIVVELKTDGVQ